MKKKFGNYHFISNLSFNLIVLIVKKSHSIKDGRKKVSAETSTCPSVIPLLAFDNQKLKISSDIIRNYSVGSPSQLHIITFPKRGSPCLISYYIRNKINEAILMNLPDIETGTTDMQRWESLKKWRYIKA